MGEFPSNVNDDLQEQKTVFLTTYKGMCVYVYSEVATVYIGEI